MASREAKNIFRFIYGTVRARPRMILSMLFGFLVWSVNYLGLMPALNLYNSPDREPARRHLMMIAAHLMWGITTGQVFQRLTPLLKKRLA